MSDSALPAYSGRYADFRRVEGGDENRLVYRQETTLVSQLIALVFLLLGLGTLIAATPLLVHIDELRSGGIFSIGFQWFLALLLIATGMRSLRESATITFDKFDSSITFLRKSLMPTRPVTVSLTDCESVTIRPSSFDGGLLWYGVYLTWKDGKDFGLIAVPTAAAARQFASEVSEFLGLSHVEPRV